MPEAISQTNIKTTFIILVVGALLYYYWKSKYSGKDDDNDNGNGNEKDKSNDDKTTITDIVDDINRKQL